MEVEKKFIIDCIESKGINKVIESVIQSKDLLQD